MTEISKLLDLNFLAKAYFSNLHFFWHTLYLQDFRFLDFWSFCGNPKTFFFFCQMSVFFWVKNGKNQNIKILTILFRYTSNYIPIFRLMGHFFRKRSNFRVKIGYIFRTKYPLTKYNGFPQSVKSCLMSITSVQLKLRSSMVAC